MKKVTFSLALMTSSVFAATPQQFYRAAKNANLIELNSRMNTITKEKPAEDEDEIGSTNFDFSISRGVTNNISVGLLTGNKTESHGGGLKDIVLYIEGQHEKYFYGFDLGLSADIELDNDGYPENSKSGGTNYKVTLGYVPVDYFGFKFEYTPSYTSVTQPKDSNYIELDVGPTVWFKMFTEHKIENNLIGGAFGGLKISPDVDDSDLDERYNTCEVYYRYNWTSVVELTAGLNYWFGSKNTLFSLVHEGLDVGVRLKY